MGNKNKISKGQVSFLAAGAAAGNIIYTFTFVTYLAGRPFWIAAFLGVVLNIPFAIWILLLGSYCKGKSIFEMLEIGIGKIVAKVIILIYIALNIVLAACMLNMFVQMVKVFFLERTPVSILMLFIIVLCAVFTDSGIGTFSRLIELLVTLYMANYLLGFSISFVKEFDTKYVFPVFDTTISGFTNGVLLTFGADAECLLLLLAAVGSIDNPLKEFKSVAKGILGWATFLSFAIFIQEGVDSQEMLSRVAQAGITVSRTLQIGSFVRGLEVLVLMTYQYFMVVKMIIFIYSCAHSMKTFFAAKKIRIPIIISSALIFGASMWMNSFNIGYFFSIFLSFFVILPFVLLVLIISSLCAKKVQRKSGESCDG